MDLGAIGSLHSHCFSGRGRGTFLPDARSKGPRRCLQKSKRKLRWWNRKFFLSFLKTHLSLWHFCGSDPVSGMKKERSPFWPSRLLMKDRLRINPLKRTTVDPYLAYTTFISQRHGQILLVIQRSKQTGEIGAICIGHQLKTANWWREAHCCFPTTLQGPAQVWVPWGIPKQKGSLLWNTLGSFLGDWVEFVAMISDEDYCSSALQPADEDSFEKEPLSVEMYGKTPRQICPGEP